MASGRAARVNSPLLPRVWTTYNLPYVFSWSGPISLRSQVVDSPLE